MVRRNIFIEIFAIEDILDGKLHGEILVELVVCIEIQEEVRIAGLEAAALHPRFRAVRDEHAVDIDSPWILVEGRTEMEQVTRDIVVLIAIDLARLPSVIDVGGPVVAVLLVHSDLEAVRLGFTDILVLLATLIGDRFNVVIRLGMEERSIHFRFFGKLCLCPQFPGICGLRIQLGVLMINGSLFRVTVDLIQDRRVEGSAIGYIQIQRIISRIIE